MIQRSPACRAAHMLRISHLAAGALLLLVAAVASAQSLQSQANAIVQAAQLGNAKVSIFVHDATTGQDLVEIQPDLALMPASNMKLLTTAAALASFGPDYVYSTQLRLDGDRLVIRGDGDPGFGDPVILQQLNLDPDKLIDRWVQAVLKFGVKKAELLVDDRVFDQQFVHPNWPDNQLNRWYCAEVSGVAFNDNCLDVFASPSTKGKAPLITTVPRLAAVTLDNQAKTGDKNAFWATRSPDGNRISLRGEVKQALSVPISVTVHDPSMFFAQTLANRLRASGVEITTVSRVAPSQPLAEGTLLAEVQTTMPSVLLRTNRDSQNLFAESLLKKLGHKLTGQPGSWSTGQAAIRMFLQKSIGAQAAAVVIDDGSGLSRNNRVSAQSFGRLLTYMAGQPRLRTAYLDSLAVPGRDGTLERRFVGVKLNGTVHAKSGYINGVVALSGYLLLDGRTVAFSMIVNDYHKGTDVPKRMMEKIIAAVDAKLGKKTEVKLGG